MNSRSRTYVALLFSIGIGDGRRLLMADWRTMMEEIGLNQPRTLIATGNAVATQPQPGAAGRARGHLDRQLLAVERWDVDLGAKDGLVDA